MIHNNMSIAFDRVIRMFYYDPYLPMKCFATKKQAHSIMRVCDCLIGCQFPPSNRKSRPSRERLDQPERKGDR
jgi:hypothetical protein